MTEDFYDLLEIPPDAPRKEVKRAFREQVRIYHPDHNDDDRARAQFTAVQKAYEILGDPVERTAYDRLGHEEYVAKRTSGLPSADVWRSDDSSSRSSSSRNRGLGASGGRRRAGTSGSNASTRSKRGTKRSAGRQTSSSRSRASSSASTSGSGVSSTDSTSGGDTGRSRRARTDGSTAAAESTARAGRSHMRWIAHNGIVRWWRRRHLEWPLIWGAMCTYLIGIAHFGLTQASALETLTDEATTAGADPGAILAILTESRHGVDAPLSFALGFEPIDHGLAPTEWYGLLAAVPAVSLLIVLGTRAASGRRFASRLSTDETILLALAGAAAAGLFGGPLFAGTVVLPLVFGVMVHRTRQLSGWSPTYLYVFAVCAPLAGTIAPLASVDSLALDLVAFVLAPVAGIVGLQCRASLRKRR